MPLTRRLILQKARHHPPRETSPGQALTDCRQTVSGTISLPSRGTFHLSLTVLVRYRSQGSIQPYQVVLADSQQISGVRCYSGTTQKRPAAFVYRTITVYGAASQRTSTSHKLSDSPTTCQCSPCRPTTPTTQPLTGITRRRFRLHPLSLATTHGITIVFFSYGY